MPLKGTASDLASSHQAPLPKGLSSKHCCELGLKLYCTGLCRTFEISVMVDLDWSPRWHLESLWKCISGCIYESLSRWETHFECWQHVPVGWGPGLSKEQKQAENRSSSLLPDSRRSMARRFRLLPPQPSYDDGLCPQTVSQDQLFFL